MLPNLHASIFSFIKLFYGLLMLGTLLQIWPNRNFFFTGTFWNGYVDNSSKGFGLYHPRGFLMIYFLWIASLVGLQFPEYAWIFAIINFLLCYHYFIKMRWKSLLRGMGAPGFISWWISFFIILAELSLQFAPSIFNLVLLVFQVDFALIMIAAGVYKMTSGYLSNDGMQLGLINPMWGYWWKAFSKLKYKSFLFIFYNQMAWLTEIVAGLLMLFPKTRFIGGAIMAASFVFIATQIRLGLLCAMVIVSCMVYFDQSILVLFPNFNYIPQIMFNSDIQLFSSILKAFCIFYLIMRPLILFALWINLYLEFSFPKYIQIAIDYLANSFGIILWRVFTKEVTGFYIEIYKKSDQKLVYLSRYDDIFDWRYNSVAESIAVTSIFTALKYYPSNTEIFENRLKRYSKTLSNKNGDPIVYKWIQFNFDGEVLNRCEIAVFEYDPLQDQISLTVLDPVQWKKVGISSASTKGCIKPGSYVVK